jgi:hypothetical protein
MIFGIVKGFRKGLPNETQCYSLVNLTPSGLFRILHIE